PASEATLIVRGAHGWSEATHRRPKPVDRAGQPAVFTALWTPAEGVRGDVIFTAWGAAVDGNVGNDGPRGDRAARATARVAAARPRARPSGHRRRPTRPYPLSSE